MNENAETPLVEGVEEHVIQTLTSNRLKNNIEHRLTFPGNPWTNGQVERMNRTIKKATVKKVLL